MLTLDHFHKEVRYKTVSLQSTSVTCVYAWVENDRYKLTLIPVKEFKHYTFVGYRYENSYCPNVKRISEVK